MSMSLYDSQKNLESCINSESLNINKIDTLAQAFSSEFYEIFKNIFFLQNIYGWLFLRIYIDFCESAPFMIYTKIILHQCSIFIPPENIKTTYRYIFKGA